MTRDELVEKGVIRGLLIQYFTCVPEKLPQDLMSVLRRSLEPDQEERLRSFVSILLTRDRGMSVTSASNDTQLLVLAQGFDLREPEDASNMVAGVLGVKPGSAEYEEIKNSVVSHLAAHSMRQTNRPMPPPPPPAGQRSVVPRGPSDPDSVLDRFEDTENETKAAISRAKTDLDAALAELGRIYGEIGQVKNEILDAQTEREEENTKLNAVKTETNKIRNEFQAETDKAEKGKQLLAAKIAACENQQRDLEAKNTELARLESEALQMEMTWPEKKAIAERRLEAARSQLRIAQGIMEEADRVEEHATAMVQPRASRDDETVPVAIREVALASDVEFDPSLANQLGNAVLAKDKMDAAVQSAVLLRQMAEGVLRGIAEKIHEIHGQIRARKEELSELENGKRYYIDEIEECNAEISGRSNDLKVLEKDLSGLESQVADLRQKITQIKEAIANLGEQQTDLLAQHDRDLVAYDETMRHIETKLGEIQDARLTAQGDLSQKEADWASEKADLEDRLSRLNSAASEAREFAVRETKRLGQEIQTAENNALRVTREAEVRLNRVTNLLIDLKRVFDEPLPAIEPKP